jgi:predicted nucleic acid-binding protein
MTRMTRTQVSLEEDEARAPSGMKPLFVDTSGWYDLLFSGSPKHAEILTLVRRPGASFVTTTYALDELAALLIARTDYAMAARAGSQIRSATEVRVEHPDAAEESRAWRLFLDRPDETCRLTDCLSFVVMRRLGIDTAIATDEHHFRQEGFLHVALARARGRRRAGRQLANLRADVPS